MIEALREIFRQYTPGSGRSLMRPYLWLNQPGIDNAVAWEAMSCRVHKAVQDIGSYPINILPRVFTSWTTRPHQASYYKEGWCLNWGRECCAQGMVIVRQQQVSVGKQSCLLATGIQLMTGDSSIEPLVVESPEELLDIYETATLLATPYALCGVMIERLVARHLNEGRPVRYGFDPNLEFKFLRQRRMPIAEAQLSVSTGSTTVYETVPTFLDRRRPVKELQRLLAS